MIKVLYLVVLTALTIAHVVVSMVIKRLSDEIDELKEKLEFHRIKLQYVESCELDNEKRLDQLEKVLDLKEYFDKESLNEEEK